MTDRAIIVDGLRKPYGKIVALDGLSFDVPAGTIVGLLGANGSGKTTTVAILSTALRPTGAPPRCAATRSPTRLRCAGWSGSRASTRLWTPTSPGRRTSP